MDAVKTPAGSRAGKEETRTQGVTLHLAFKTLPDCTLTIHAWPRGHRLLANWRPLPPHPSTVTWNHSSTLNFTTQLAWKGHREQKGLSGILLKENWIVLKQYGLKGACIKKSSR